VRGTKRAAEIYCGVRTKKEERIEQENWNEKDVESLLANDSDGGFLVLPERDGCGANRAEFTERAGEPEPPAGAVE
jgi:hypothetical protein